MSLSSLTIAHRRSPTPKTKMKILVGAVMGIQHMLILEEVLIKEGHHIGRLFGTAFLLRKRGPCSDQHL
jgi:hypothetical protein